MGGPDADFSNVKHPQRARIRPAIRRLNPDIRDDILPKLDAGRETPLARAAKDEIKARQDYFTARLDARLKQAGEGVANRPERAREALRMHVQAIDDADLTPNARKALKARAESVLLSPPPVQSGVKPAAKDSSRTQAGESYDPETASDAPGVSSAPHSEQPANKKSGVVSGQATPFKAMQSRSKSELRNYDPTVHEQAKYLLSDALLGLGMSKYEANRQAGKLTQAAEFTPVIGDAADIGEAARNPTAVNIGVAGLGLVPALGDVVKKALRQSVKRVKKLGTKSEFVIGTDGRINLGNIGPEVTIVSKGQYEPAPIRLEFGVPGPGGFGKEHITPDKHIRAKELGYKDNIELIEHVAKSHDTVVQQVGGRLMLVTRQNANRYIIIEYHRGWGWLLWVGKRDPYYGVTTGYPESRRNVGKLKRTGLYRELHKRGGKLLKGEDVKKND